jgi:hypothetical protein
MSPREFSEKTLVPVSLVLVAGGLIWSIAIMSSKVDAAFKELERHEQIIQKLTDIQNEVSKNLAILADKHTHDKR